MVLANTPLGTTTITPASEIGPRLALDPRTKFIMLLLVNMMVFNGHSVLAPIILMVVTVGIMALVVADLGDRAGIIFTGIAASLWLITYAGQWWDSVVTMVLGFVGFWLLRFFLSATMAWWVLRTVAVSEFTESLYALRLPRVLIIPLVVMFRFFPVVVEELRGIYEALILRGFYGAQLWLHPVRAVEYIIVPLLSATARIADELAAAAMMRGLGLHRHPTRMGSIGFSLTDTLLLPVVVTLAVLSWWTPAAVLDLLS